MPKYNIIFWSVLFVISHVVGSQVAFGQFQENAEMHDIREYSVAKTTDQEAKKSVANARLLSLGATIGPLLAAEVISPGHWLYTDDHSPGVNILRAGAIFIGPTTGSLYAHDRKRALRGIGIRTGTALASYLTLRTADTMNISSPHGIILIAMPFIIVMSAAYDIFTTSENSVQDYNKKIANNYSMSISPYLGAENEIGLTFSLNF